MSSGGAFHEDALAGFGRGSQVWVSASGEDSGNELANARRDVEAYLPATVVRIGDQTCEVKVNDDVQVTEVPRASVFPANPDMLAKARDLTSLSYLNEPIFKKPDFYVNVAFQTFFCAAFMAAFLTDKPKKA